MREILFRGKRVDNGKWVYGSAENYGEYGFGIKEQGLIKSGTIYVTPKVILESVGEFTGLYDKNNVRIFEGDIVEATSQYDEHYLHRFEVKFGECGNSGYPEFGYLGFYFDEITTERRLRTDILYWLNDYECKVIGNIYDNPELLKH